MNTRYAVVLTCGVAAEPARQLADHVVDITPDEPTPDAALAALARSGVTPADMRSQVVFAAAGDVHTALLAYAAAIGFASRQLDIATAKGQLATEPLHQQLSRLADAGRPDVKPERVELVAQDAANAAAPGPATLVWDASAGLAVLSPQVVTGLRYARRVGWTAPSDLSLALATLVMVAGMRFRRGYERLPLLASTHDAADEGTFCLDTVRQQAGDLRRTSRVYTVQVVEARPASARQELYAEAAARDVAATMALLGAKHNADADAWHCPRPERHTNGDAVPSMTVEDDEQGGMVRCMRCDREPLDALRLVIDTLGLTPGEAAELLDDPARTWASELISRRRSSHPALA